MNNELERICKEAVVAVLSWYLPGRTENYEKPSVIIPVSGPRSEPGTSRTRSRSDTTNKQFLAFEG
jgi:hypothetical protein